MLIAGIVLLATIAPPVHSGGKGVPPEKFFMVDIGGPFVETEEFIECPGFGTEITFTFGGFWMYHPATAGRDGWEFYHSAWPIKIANAEDESLFVEGVPGQVMNRHWVGEPFESDPIETGVQLMVVLPGYGVILRDVGRIRYDIDTFDIEFIAGHWDTWEEDFQALCAALTP